MGMSSINNSKNLNNFVDNSLIGEQNYSSYLDTLMNSEDEESTIEKNISLHKNEVKQESKLSDSNNNNEKVPTVFEWDNNDKCVYLTGSFCNWNQFFLMKKDNDGKYKITLYLNKGFHQYKFKINNEWKCNYNFPTYNDNGYINNYIDTSNLKTDTTNEDEKFNTIKNLSTDFEEEKENEKSSIETRVMHFKCKNLINACNKYTDYIPHKNEFSKNTPLSPYQYKCDPVKILRLNRLDAMKNKRKNNEIEEEKKNWEKNAKINFYSEQINHLHSKEKEINFNKKVMICSIVSRYRLKFTNFIYYK